ncbi:MAG: mannose-1-phosphate guanylyltransferase/mannose-6-phosphate isomerase [Gammaproteobacteria bacterium]|nr:MAG: mannose-1-phosphate guanylyltransferase/mannose-6-phosphate isomerase [Gammaproteobacteria bacterium]
MLIPVIISGGAGARLWPVSRESDPKPFMQLPDGNSIIGKTFARAANLSGVADILVVTNQNYYFRTREEFEKSCDGVKLDFVLEPFGKNTAPAIAAAAFRVKERFGEDVVMLVLPADHLISQQDIFQLAVDNAVELAEQDFLATFGIEPTHPETGFGYIEKGGSISESGFEVFRFVEKPDLGKAQEYLASGKFVWNSGMFCFKASAFLEALSQYTPEMFEQISSCWEQTNADSLPLVLDADSLKRVEGDSIDYAVMEKANNVAVVSAAFEWNDIGSWAAMADVFDEDSNGNAVEGDVIAIDSNNCLVDSKQRLTAVVGVNDIVVVNDEDATLVVHKDKVQDVKKVVEALKQGQRPEYSEKKTTRRPWGGYTNLIESAGYKVKKIVVFPGQSLSLQKHMHRSEHWTVVVGKAEVVNGAETKVLEANQSIYIEKEAVHRLTNIGGTDLQLIEVQCGDYLGEDDIIRLQDNYGRI